MKLIGYHDGIPVYNGTYDDGLGALHGEEKRDVYDMVNEMLIALIENENITAESVLRNKIGGFPKNMETKKTYQGVNFYLLGYILPFIRNDYASLPYFLTFKQIKEKGGNVKKGSKGYPVVYYTPIERDIRTGKRLTDSDSVPEEFINKYFALKYYYVFNIADTEGIDTTGLQIEVSEEKKELLSRNKRIEVCEKIASLMPQRPKMVIDPYLKHALGRYTVNTHTVSMLPYGLFKDVEFFYSTLFHELGHATGNVNLLNRTFGNAGTVQYAKEELIAELCAAYLCGTANILFRTKENNSAYIKHWGKRLKENIKDDKKFFFTAAAAAQKAADFILDLDADGIPAYKRVDTWQPVEILTVLPKDAYKEYSGDNESEFLPKGYKDKNKTDENKSKKRFKMALQAQARKRKLLLA